MNTDSRRTGPGRSAVRHGGRRPTIRAALPRSPTVWIAGVLSAAVAVGLVVAWRALRPVVVTDRQYQLDPSQIHIPPQPTWIRADVRAEVLRDASLDHPLSILDDRLAERIAAAFEFHPWVAEVRRVVKRFGPSVQVDLVYRKPVLMVQVTTDDCRALRPADIDGVRLPDADFAAAEERHYPLLRGARGEPLVGSRWDDPSVLEAARLVAVMGDLWNALALARIDVVRPGPEPTDGRRLSYELVSRHGLRIRWGHAPQSPRPTTAADRSKLAHLASLAQGLRSPAAAVPAPRVVDIRGRRELAEHSPDQRDSAAKR